MTTATTTVMGGTAPIHVDDNNDGQSHLEEEDEVGRMRKKAEVSTSSSFLLLSNS